MPRRKVTIVVPIYGDWPSLKHCIGSLKEHVDTSVHQVILANDCGPEADELERQIKASIKGVSGFNYYRNPKNLGFVGNCNRVVLELDQTDNDVLLLNSDTKVTAGFLDEMLSVLYDNKKRVGAVSPRSNNATICTLPLAAIKEHGIDADKSFELFQKYKSKFPKYNVAPTAHGFCMLVRRSLIKEHGLFDPAFGKGYGEEVDFCQRIQKAGWACVVSNRSYVFHLEAKSFSLETKAELLQVNNKIIHQRYPEYKQAVTDYINIALAEEKRIMGKDAVSQTQLSGKSKLINLVKGSKTMYALARGIRRTFRRWF